MMQPLFDAEAREYLSRSLDRFVVDRYNFETHRRLVATDCGFGRAEWSEMAELGWHCLSLPSQYGGMDGGASETALVMDAIGRGLMLEPYIATVVLSGRLIASCGTAEQCDALLPLISAGDCMLAFAHQDLSEEATAMCSPDGDGWSINGAKTFVLHGDIADQLVVTAVAGGETILLLVAADAPGVFRKNYKLIDGRGISEIRFEGAFAERIGSSNVATAVADVLDYANSAVCAEAVGAMSVLNDQTLDYVKTRQQFGTTIGSFQALQHRLVDMKVAEQEVRSISQTAAAALDAGHAQASVLVSAAKVRTCRAARFIGESAVQIHGGIGMTDELPIGAYFKRLLAIESLFGDKDQHLDRISAVGDVV